MRGCSPPNGFDPPTALPTAAASSTWPAAWSSTRSRSTTSCLELEHLRRPRAAQPALPPGAVDKFDLLKYGLGVVLAFLGLKMVWLNRAFGGHFPIVPSLAIIVGIIEASIILSLLFPKPPEEAPWPRRKSAS
jgi:hypothetical protein